LIVPHEVLVARREALLPVLSGLLAERFKKRPPVADVAVHNGGLLLRVGKGNSQRVNGILSAKEVVNHRWREIAETNMRAFFEARSEGSETA
jgi:hypothetical protein